MSQADIVDLLEKKKEPLTSKEISEILKVRQENIITSLRKLMKFKEVSSEKLNEKQAEQRGMHPKNGLRYVRIFWIK